MATITHFRRAQSPEHTIVSEVNVFLAYCRDRRGLSANTVAAYRKDLAAAAITLSASLERIAIADIETYLVSRNEKPSTTNRRIVGLRRFFRWAERQGYCDRNPLDAIDAKQDNEHLPRPIQTDADLRVLDSAIAHAPQPYRRIFTLLRETGMRADEVLSLNISNVVLDIGREGLHVREAKNNRDRIVVLDSDRMKRSLLAQKCP